MKTALRILPVAAALSLAACAKESVSAPWLTYPGVDGHIRFLPLLGTSHDPTLAGSAVTCAGCHPGDTFTQPVCTTCHGQSATDGLHTINAAGQFLTDYTWTPPPPAAWQRPSCLVCHPQGGIPDASHHSFFPVADGTPHSRANLAVATAAAGSYCKVCHSAPLDKKNLATLACVTCHTSGAVRAPLPGAHATLLTVDAYPIVPSPRDCLRCHDGGQVDRIAAHGSKQGPAGFGRAGPWDSDPQRCPGSSEKHGCPNTPVTCFKCHDAAPPVFGGAGPGLPSRPWAQDWKLPATTANQTAATACRACHDVKN